MTVLTDKPKVDRTDATLLVEELVEIYTITLRAGLKPKKIIGID